MALRLNRPLVILDLETTGLDVSTARIVEIALIRLEVDGRETPWVQRVNPGIPIPSQATAVHGITDADVSQAPSFQALIPQIDNLLLDADLGGYNSNRYDIPLLCEEYLRHGRELYLTGRHLVDAMIIFQRMEPRTLAGAYKKYCGKDLAGAHSALADTTAAKEILQAQTAYYDGIAQEVEGLAELCHNENADRSGRLGYNATREVIFRFGKHRDQTVREVFTKDPGYYDWMMRGDFPSDTKAIVTKIFEELHPRR